MEKRWLGPHNTEWNRTHKIQRMGSQDEHLFADPVYRSPEFLCSESGHTKQHIMSAKGKAEQTRTKSSYVQDTIIRSTLDTLATLKSK